MRQGGNLLVAHTMPRTPQALPLGLCARHAKPHTLRNPRPLELRDGAQDVQLQLAGGSVGPLLVLR